MDGRGCVLGALSVVTFGAIFGLLLYLMAGPQPF